MGYAYGYQYGYRRNPPAVEEPGETLGPNLLVNSSCTAGGGGWTNEDGDLPMTNDRIDFAAVGLIAQQGIAGGVLEPGSTYRLTFSSEHDGEGLFRFVMTNFTPGVAAPPENSGVNTYDATFTGAEGASSAIFFNDPAESATGWIDDIELRKVT